MRRYEIRHSCMFVLWYQRLVIPQIAMRAYRHATLCTDIYNATTARMTNDGAHVKVTDKTRTFVNFLYITQGSSESFSTWMNRSNVVLFLGVST